MLDAGGGGGTAWSAMPMKQMNDLIQNPNVGQHWELLTGWRRSADLVNEHRSQVQSYRDNLAAVWPPGKSEAAAAYLARLDELIANLTETYEAAVANYTAFSTATLSISLAQKDVAEIYREYEANEKLIAAQAAAQQERSASGTPSPTPAPSGEQPPVAPGRQEELRWKAVGLLGGVSTELAHAQVSLVRPQLYDPARRINDPVVNDGGYTAPPIPLVTPTARANTPVSRSKAPAITFPGGGSAQPAPPAVPSGLGAQQPGLILGGATPSAPPAFSASPPPPPVGNAPLPNAGTLPPTVSTPPNALMPRTESAINRGVTPREGLIRPAAPSPSAFHAMPPGGIIGGAPPISGGRPSTSSPGVRHVNPVGGMIGGGANPGGPGARFASDAHSAYGSAYGRGGHDNSIRRNTEDGRRWDPENPWETAEGVAPVVLPPRERRIDPGPAIGLP